MVVDRRRVHHLRLVQCREQLLFHSVIFVYMDGAHGGVQFGLAGTRGVERILHLGGFGPREVPVVRDLRPLDALHQLEVRVVLRIQLAVMVRLLKTLGELYCLRVHISDFVS